LIGGGGPEKTEEQKLSEEHRKILLEQYSCKTHDDFKNALMNWTRQFV
jgi:hypothetical protein